MKANTATVTMADVARDADVSVSSVSNYLHGRPYMKAGMRARIADSIDRLGYQVNAVASNLRSGRTHLLKLSIPDLRQMYFSELAEDILAEARVHGYGVIVESTTNSRDRELDSVASMGTRAADGLIFSPLLMNDDDEHVLDGDYPLVLLGERLCTRKVAHVVIANRTAAHDATSHLIAAGCRSIAVVGGVRAIQGQASSRQIRTEGYRDALASAGMGYDPELVYETVGWGSEDGAEAVRRMILDGARCDGIFALNDRLAWGVLRGLRVSGIRCPGDVRVVGFDDVDESAYMVPSLTTVDPGKRDIARIAVQSVIDQITRGSRGPAGMLETPCSLVFRESSPAV